MSTLQLSGVYAITCVPTGRQYVGSAVHFGKRFWLHRHQLRQGKHHSRFMQRAWTKYGEQAFEFRPLLVCAPGQLLEYEQRVIDRYQPKFNMAPTAGSTLGLKHTQGARLANQKRCQEQRGTPEWKAAQSIRIKKAYAEGKLAHNNAKLLAHNAALSPEERRQKYTPEVRARIAELARARGRRYPVEGNYYTVTEAAEAFGVSRGLLKNRMRYGWSLEKAVLTPIDTKHRGKECRR